MSRMSATVLPISGFAATGSVACRVRRDSPETQRVLSYGAPAATWNGTTSTVRWVVLFLFVVDALVVPVGAARGGEEGRVLARARGYVAVAPVAAGTPVTPGDAAFPRLALSTENDMLVVSVADRAAGPARVRRGGRDDPRIRNDDGLRIEILARSGAISRFAVNRNGAVLDERVLPGGASDPGWNCAVVASAGGEGDVWSLSVRLPVPALGVAPGPGRGVPVRITRSAGGRPGESGPDVVLLDGFSGAGVAAGVPAAVGDVVFRRHDAERVVAEPACIGLRPADTVVLRVLSSAGRSVIERRLPSAKASHRLAVFLPDGVLPERGAVEATVFRADRRVSMLRAPLERDARPRSCADEDVYAAAFDAEEFRRIRTLLHRGRAAEARARFREAVGAWWAEHPLPTTPTESGVAPRVPDWELLHDSEDMTDLYRICARLPGLGRPSGKDPTEAAEAARAVLTAWMAHAGGRRGADERALRICWNPETAIRRAENAILAAGRVFLPAADDAGLLLAFRIALDAQRAAWDAVAPDFRGVAPDLLARMHAVSDMTAFMAESASRRDRIGEASRRLVSTLVLPDGMPADGVFFGDAFEAVELATGEPTDAGAALLRLLAVASAGDDAFHFAPEAGAAERARLDRLLDARFPEPGADDEPESLLRVFPRRGTPCHGGCFILRDGAAPDALTAGVVFPPRENRAHAFGAVSLGVGGELLVSCGDAARGSVLLVDGKPPASDAGPPAGRPLAWRWIVTPFFQAVTGEWAGRRLSSRTLLLCASPSGPPCCIVVDRVSDLPGRKDGELRLAQRFIVDEASVDGGVARIGSEAGPAVRLTASGESRVGYADGVVRVENSGEDACLATVILPDGTRASRVESLAVEPAGATGRRIVRDDGDDILLAAPESGGDVRSDTPVPIRSDAALLLVRRSGTRISGAALAAGSRFSVGDGDDRRVCVFSERTSAWIGFDRDGSVRVHLDPTERRAVSLDVRIERGERTLEAEVLPEAGRSVRFRPF